VRQQASVLRLASLQAQNGYFKPKVPATSPRPVSPPVLAPALYDRI
jgi:hypothetical protein